MSGREYLTFTARERSGIIALFIVVLAVAIVPKYFLANQNDMVHVPENLPELSTGGRSVTRESDIIDSSSHNETHHYRPASMSHKQKSEIYPKKHLIPFDINSADTAQFIALPGIGSKLASRIVLFREKLGGFYDVGQVAEVYGLQDSIFRKILPMLKCNPALLRKIDVNDASVEVLKAHPYIRWKNATLIVAYRKEHGRFYTDDDLKSIESLDSNDLRKFIPYFAYE